MASKWADWLVFLILIGWGTALLAGIGVLQRPLFVPEALALGEPLRGVLVAGWVLAAATGLGRTLLHPIGLAEREGEHWLAAALLGMGALGSGWLLLGLLRLPPAPLTALLLALPLGRFLRDRPPLPRPSLPLPVGLLLAAFALLSALEALAPPTAFDALLYHLRLPELWLQGESLFQAQKAAPFFFPVLVEALLVPAMQLGGPSAAALLDWCFFPLALGLLWAITRRFVPQADAPLVLGLALSIQLFPVLASWSYTDIALACYQVGTVWALLHWREGEQRGWLWLAAAFTGMAMGIKYLAVFTPMLALATILWTRRRGALPAMVQFALIALAVGAPSYARNWLATGNPFFPFALPSRYWDEFRGAWYAAAGSGIGWSLREWLAVPWLTTLGLRDTSYYDARPGPLLATFSPLGLWFWLRGAGQSAERRTLALLGSFALGYGLLWFVGIINSASLWQGRFLLTPLLLLCPVAAWGIQQAARLVTPRFSPARLGRLLVGVWAVLALFIHGVAFARAEIPAVLLGHQSPAAWREARLGGYERLVEQMGGLEAESRTLLLVEPRSLGMPPTTEADTVLYEFPWRLARVRNDTTRLTAELCVEGFTHAAIYWRGVRFLNEEARVNALSDEQLQLLETWRGTHERLWLDPTGSHELVRLRCPAAP